MPWEAWTCAARVARVLRTTHGLGPDPRGMLGGPQGTRLAMCAGMQSIATHAPRPHFGLAALGSVSLLLLRLAWALLRIRNGGKRGGERAQDALNDVFAYAEAQGWMPRAPAFDLELADYPELHALTGAYPAIRDECLAALALRARMPDMRELGGAYTDTQLNRIRWKALMLKSGGAAIAENCAVCPRTGALLAALPSVFNAFFSVLEPGQRIVPHFGYYKGFVRYHLGVLIPNDNAGGECWLRVHADAGDNARRDKTAIERGQKHYWRNGQAVIFDDTYLHDACNGANEVRVVLFVDVLRKLPPWLAAFNRLALAAAYRFEPALRTMAKTAALKPVSTDSP
jgi:ornithine lipid ester-linked acyl 2-hydroxylase